MKKITYNFLFLLTIVLLNVVKVQAQERPVAAQNKNIQQFIQVWGLVKYKSQKSITGQFDADKVFLGLIDQVKNADEKQFNQLMLEMIGSVDPSLAAQAQNYNRKKTDPLYLIKNVDYSWIKDKGYTVALKQQLTALSKQVNLTGKHQYIPTVAYDGDLPNEDKYADYTFNQEGMNLLALAKSWNAIEYLFPYKYMMDKNTKAVLIEMIPVFRSINNRVSYEKSVLLLEVAINDSHGLLYMRKMRASNTIFNVVYYPPFDYKAEANGIIIKKFLNDSLAKNSELKVGDQIVAINGIKIGQWMKERMALIPASNMAVKYRELNPSDRGNTFSFSNLESQNLMVKVARGKQLLNLKLEMLDRRNRELMKIPQRYLQQKGEEQGLLKAQENIGNDITLFRAGSFYEKDLPQDEAQLSSELKSKKGLIFDLREYPQAPVFWSSYLTRMLGKAPFAFARYYAADLKDPGAFVLRQAVEAYMDINGPKPIGDLYTGKIVILVNEESQSMSEWFTILLSQLNANTTIIGSQTAGADGDLKKLNLPGGYQFYFTGNGIFLPDGRETQRIGIVPDIYFKPSIKDLIGTEDAHVQRAIQFIREGK